MDSMQRATSFMQNLHGFSVVVAGGCARDLMLGEVPRDYDLWVVDDTDVSEALGIVQEALLEHRIKYDEFVEVPEVCAEDYGSVEDADIEWVIKVKIEETEIDVIKVVRPSGESVTPAQIVSTFDYPINQFWVAREGVVGIGHVHFNQHPLRALQPNRVEYMQRKFPTLYFHQLPDEPFN